MFAWSQLITYIDKACFACEDEDATVSERRQAKVYHKQSGRLLNCQRSTTLPLISSQVLALLAYRQRCDSLIRNAHSNTRSRVDTGDGWTSTSSIRLSIEKVCESFVESTTTRWWWWCYWDKEVLGDLWSGTAARYTTTMLSLTVLVMI